MIRLTTAAARIAVDIELHLLTKGNRSMTPELREQILALADALGPLANDAAQIHTDLRAQGDWGTGVTAGLERKLGEIDKSLRYLLTLNQRIVD